MQQSIHITRFAKKLTTLSVLTVMCVVAYAQQIEEFSLFRENAVALNPAMVGAKGYLAGGFAFRKQFSEITDAPYTGYLNMEGQLADKNVGLGGSMIFDRTGPTGRVGGTVSAAYQVKLGNAYDLLNEEHIHYNTESRHMITFGLSLSVMQFRLNGNALHPEMTGDPGLYTNTATKFTPDLAFGIYYQWKQHLYAGISVPQIMGLNVTYNGNFGTASIKTVQHLNFLIGGKIVVRKHKFSIDPAGAFRWVHNAPPQSDIGLRFTFYDAIWVGATYRTASTTILDVGIEMKGLVRVSYAYDYNFSPFHGEIGSTHELSIGFRFNHDKDELRDRKFLAGIEQQ